MNCFGDSNDSSVLYTLEEKSKTTKNPLELSHSSLENL